MRTKITNTSGEDQHFGWIPPHGVDLADSEETTVEGDLRTVLAGGRGRYSRKTEINALNEAIDSGVATEEAVAAPSSSSSTP